MTTAPPVDIFFLFFLSTVSTEESVLFDSNSFAFCCVMKIFLSLKRIISSLGTIISLVPSAFVISLPMSDGISISVKTVGLSSL